MSKILVVEDDLSLAGLVKDFLTHEQHRVDLAKTGEEALAVLRDQEYDLLVFDLDLPGISGMQVLNKYRSNGGVAPVLILTAQQHINSKVEGFAQGADDYLTKPFEPKELSMRVMALLRRPPLKYTKVLTVGDLELDLLNSMLKVRGAPVDLDPRELTMLEFFMRNANQVFSQEELINWVWPGDVRPSDGAVTTCIKRLRKKIDTPDAESHIRTIYGAGYCMDDKS